MDRRMMNYNDYKSKQDARALNIEEAQKALGVKRLPKGYRYMTLAGDQTHPKSEIRQAKSMGFIEYEQVIGIDLNRQIIKANRRAFPKSTWIHGRWEEVIRDLKLRPSFVYLDTQNMPDKAVELATSTIIRLPPQSFLAVNVVMAIRHKRFGTKEFFEKLKKNAPFKALTGWIGLRGYTYSNCGKSTMSTYLYIKQA